VDGDEVVGSGGGWEMWDGRGWTSGGGERLW
jgi:hypothetical protein